MEGWRDKRSTRMVLTACAYEIDIPISTVKLLLVTQTHFRVVTEHHDVLNAQCVDSCEHA
jgi:hypothetical protein